MAGDRRGRSLQSSPWQGLIRKTTIRRGSPCTKIPEEVKSTKSHIFSPSIAENVFSFLDKKEKVEYYERFGNDGLGRCLLTCEQLEGKALSNFVYFLTLLPKETLTMWVQAMNPQLIVKICEEAEPYVLADFVECLGSSLMNNVLKVLHENDAYNNMREDKLVTLFCVLQIYGFLHKIYQIDEAMLSVGNYLVNKRPNDNINKSNKSKYCPVVSFFKAKICRNSSASSASGVLPYSYMNSEGESCDMHPRHLDQKVVCPVPWMNSDGESCHNYLRSQQQLHAVVNLNYKVVSCGTHAEIHISIDNVRCRVVYYPSCSGDLARSYYVCRITIKVEPQPSDIFDDEIPELKPPKSTCDDPRTLQSGRELSAAINFPMLSTKVDATATKSTTKDVVQSGGELSATVNSPKVSAQIGAKATQSTTKNEVQWTYRQFDDGNNIGGMEWTYNSSSIGGDFVFSDDKYPESLIWRINQDITKPKTLCWRIRTHFNLKSSHSRNHIISHEVTQRFNSTI